MPAAANIHTPRETSVNAAMLLEYLSAKVAAGGRLSVIDYGMVAQIWGLIQCEQASLNPHNTVNITIAAQTLRGLLARMNA